MLFSAIAICFAVLTTPTFGQSTTELVSRELSRFTCVNKVQKRANSPTDVCKRWAHQSAVVNGTLYIYGGEATTSSDQSDKTWNNNFISLDLKKSWQITSPQLTGLPQPSGPPAIALGHLWHSYDSLALYGGEFSSKNPLGTPTTFSLWEYDIKSSSWREHKDPKTSTGKNSEPGNQAIVRVAEGAGVSVPELGMSWYFGGHIDGYTTPGWSQSTYRVYLKSFVEYTFPGYSNDGVESLTDGKKAGADGAWRNITEAGIQDQNGFTSRADGLLVHIPGWGEKGILLSLAGGTNTTFTQMNAVDVYDIATTSWYKQATRGPTPKIRVNPCAVVAAAADGSSHQVYMFGGQNLQPTYGQTQYDDMWILSIPSFTWIQVDASKQSVPYPRAGHTCNIWDGQMVVIGGYIGQDISCESPGIYVFNTSSLEWSTSFTSLSGSAKDNPFSQQLSQRGDGKKAGIHGSYGYTVPKPVYDVIGGSSKGGATITAPVEQATAGPLATGKPYTYTLTDANGGITTGVANASGSPSKGGTNVGAAVAGAVAGFLFILALYLLFCAMLYRKQLAVYKRHVTMVAENPRTKFPDPEVADGSLRSAWKRASFMPGGYSGAKTSTEGSSFSHSTYPPDNGMSNLTHSNSPYGEGGLATSNEDLLRTSEPSYWGVLLHPRRSLRVINR